MFALPRRYRRSSVGGWESIITLSYDFGAGRKEGRKEGYDIIGGRDGGRGESVVVMGGRGR